MTAEHPSFLALDRAAAGAPTPAVTRHIAACADCRAHVDAVGCTPSLPDELPGWLPAERPRLPRLVWLAPAAVALAAALLLWPALWPARPPAPASYVGAKGAPAAVVFVRRGDDVQRWQGDPLRPGDALRLGLDLRRRTHVTIYGARGDRRPRLFAGWLEPGAPTLVDRAWQLDDAPGPERVWIVFGAPDAPPLLTADGLRWLALRPRARVEALTFTKEPRR